MFADAALAVSVDAGGTASEIAVFRLARVDFEDELVTADADMVTDGKNRAGVNPLALDLDTVGRPQIHNHETGSGIDDRGAVAADVGSGGTGLIPGQKGQRGRRGGCRVARKGGLKGITQL